MSDDDVKLLIDTLTAAVAAGQQVSVPAERVLELHARLLVAKMEAAESARDALAQPEATACPHIRSSGTGGWATHWCALAEQPQPEAPSGWIACSERMPPESTRVLVAHTGLSLFVRPGTWQDGEWWKDGGMALVGVVTHWRPLPPAPEGAGEKR